MPTDGNVPASISSDALFAKSQQFIAAAMDSREATDPSIFPLNAALALELLAKSALSFKHPSLVVDVQRNENTLLAAAGIPVETRVATINADTAYARMKHLSPRFRESVRRSCKALSDARNAHLHSGELPFASGDNSKWEPSFWYAAELILETMGRSFEDWLGAEGATVSKAVLAHAKAARRSAVSVRIVEHKAHFLEKFPKKRQQQQETKKSEGIDPYLTGRRELYEWFDEYWHTECPACECTGVSGGNHAETLLADDQDGMELGFERVERIYDITEFFCPSCGLRLNADEAYVAGLEEPHIVETEREIEWEPDYGND